MCNYVTGVVLLYQQKLGEEQSDFNAMRKFLVILRKKHLLRLQQQHPGKKNVVPFIKAHEIQKDENDPSKKLEARLAVFS